MTQPDFREQQPLTPPPSHGEPTNRQVYNIVSDTITGPNIRLRDNLYQAAFIAICAVLGVPFGWLGARWTGGTPSDEIGYAIVGGFLGLVIGLFSSGIFLMFLRGVLHLRGKHD